jgi:hypothetical protein
MSKPPVTTDPATLANIVVGLGGVPVAAATFQFDLPRSEVKTVIPQINSLGIRARNIGERVEDDPLRPGCNRSVVRIELFRSDERTFDVPEW